MTATATTTQPKLYQYNVCPFCWKVKALLGYKKIPYESVEVHPLNKKEIKFSKEWRKVPILMDGQGEQINDSTPIMRHLDEQYPENRVFEQEPKAKEEEDKWVKWGDEVLVRALPPLIYRNISDSLKAFDYITQEEKFSWIQQRTVKYSGAFVMKMVAKKTAKSQGITDPQIHVRKCINKLGDALEKQNFLGGKKPNGADLALFGILKSIEKLPAFTFIQENEKVHQWYDKVTELTLETV